ncbi:MAG: biopolymer transporter ExbD [candidate division KSB1 bacterium]|nr:biopolymer transporter ExbD [candidate division KSB1 bacterium]
MEFRTRRRLIVTFSAISLTDIVLLLLIFFLLSSSYVVQPGIRVELPKAVSAEPTVEQRLVITVTRDQEIFLNGRRVLLAELGAEVRRLLAQAPDQLVVIQADQDLSLARTIEVVDAAKLAGATRFLIATRPGV